MAPARSHSWMGFTKRMDGFPATCFNSASSLGGPNYGARTFLPPPLSLTTALLATTDLNIGGPLVPLRVAAAQRQRLKRAAAMRHA